MNKKVRNPAYPPKSMSSMTDPGRQKLLRDLEEIEAAAEKVLADQERCKLYDINLRKTQEALNRLKDPDAPSDVWTCLARQFFSVPRFSLQTALQSDVSTYKAEVNTLRDRIKEELNFLRELEGKNPLQGFNLEPLSSDELSSLNSGGDL
ncbi:unnamed protein product [Dibothriocephalus latus]|uniref:P53 and DNA damage-regulated protein 1 n=1 Tax=Dibothriocephalus latus TaxID=60516 RepID=A0A3P7LJF0_DIBLA|nr:unnamed protein product [Dibothriocephalus latus]